jgi:hypothetical protein
MRFNLKLLLVLFLDDRVGFRVFIQNGFGDEFRHGSSTLERRRGEIIGVRRRREIRERRRRRRESLVRRRLRNRRESNAGDGRRHGGGSGRGEFNLSVSVIAEGGAGVLQ